MSIDIIIAAVRFLRLNTNADCKNAILRGIAQHGRNLIVK
jgi:hypothetical protein